jgi:hypothetical protein
VQEVACCVSGCTKCRCHDQVAGLGQGLGEGWMEQAEMSCLSLM